MGNADDLTVNNITDQLRDRLEGSFRWRLLSELEEKLELAGRNTKALGGVNTWLTNELEELATAEDPGTADDRHILVAQNILGIISQRSNFTAREQEEIFIYKAPLVQDRTYALKKGAECQNKNKMNFGRHNNAAEVCLSFPFYKCNNATPALMDDTIDAKILRFANLFTDFCKSKGVDCDLKPLRNNSDVSEEPRAG